MAKVAVVSKLPPEFFSTLETVTDSLASSTPLLIETVVSGGQTGVDRAALDAAMENGIAIGGWCPRGRRSERGIIPKRYPLQETESRSYSVRTEWNVRDSDGTLIVVMDKVSGGTKLTVGFAKKAGKPCYVVHLRPEESENLFQDENSLTEQIDSVVDWICQHRIRVLNVAGPRGSSHTDIYAEALAFVSGVLKRMVTAS